LARRRCRQWQKDSDRSTQLGQGGFKPTLPDPAMMTSAQIAALPYRPCVGIMLVNRDRQVFVGQRRDNNQAAWQMPQGGIDPGEDVPTAALRELWEETGIAADLVRIEAQTAQPIPYDLPSELVGKFWGGRYRGQAQTWVLMRFLGTDAQVNIATEHPEFSGWRWSEPGELVPNIVAFKRDVYRRVIQELGHLL
jgi:putative (di)nucleoside polyphosphate hydrolase